MVPVVHNALRGSTGRFHLRPTLKLITALMTVTVLYPITAVASSIGIGDVQTWSYDATANGCSSCQATVIFELVSSTELKITFENGSIDNLAGVNILTGMAFDAVENLSGLSILSQQIEGGKTWKLTGGIGAGTWEVALASKNGINNGLDNQSDLADGGWVIVGWDSPLNLLALGIESSVTKFQAAGADADGIHAVGTRSGTTNSEPPDGDGPVTVPEPSSLLLLAAGVVAWGRRLARSGGGRPTPGH